MITKTWDDGPTDGNPYRIKLDDGGVNLWGLFDEDDCVRARPAASINRICLGL